MNTSGCDCGFQHPKRDSDIGTLTGLGKTKCAVCGEATRDHESLICPVLAAAGIDPLIQRSSSKNTPTRPIPGKLAEHPPLVVAV